MKLYSNTAVKDSITFPDDGAVVSDIDWWFIYNPESKEIIVNPQQCGGCIYSPFTLVVADTHEECLAYIQENELI